VPLLNRFFSKPDRDIAAPTQCGVVLRLVCYLIFGAGELAATILVMFVGHWLLLKVDSARIMPVGTSDVQFPIYSTTPKTPCRCHISLGREKKINRISSAANRSVKVLLLARDRTVFSASSNF
jgi:hypothetical protein